MVISALIFCSTEVQKNRTFLIYCEEKRRKSEKYVIVGLTLITILHMKHSACYLSFSLLELDTFLRFFLDFHELFQFSTVKFHELLNRQILYK